jgi:chromosomal replication initiator protein
MIAVAWSEPQPDAPQPRPLCMRDIIEAVALEHGLTCAQMLSRRRDRNLVYARQHAMWRCHRETSASLPEIGRAFGGYDHTTVIHAIRAHSKRTGVGNGNV